MSEFNAKNLYEIAEAIEDKNIMINYLFDIDQMRRLASRGQFCYQTHELTREFFLWLVKKKFKIYGEDISGTLHRLHEEDIDSLNKIFTNFIIRWDYI